MPGPCTPLRGREPTVNRTTLTFGAGILLCAASLFYLQAQFDKSDHRKGESLVRNFTAPGRSQTFEAFLLERHAGVAGLWATSITGGCRGVVRVTYEVPGVPPTLYAWEVEIPSQAVHPTGASPSGERALLEYVTIPKPLPPLDLPPLPDAAPAAGE